MPIYSPGNTGNPIRMLGSRFFRPVVIINHYRLPGDAEIGSYAITGTVATVARSNARLDVGQADPTGIGSYTIIGVPSLNAYTLGVASGSYALTGTAAAFDYYVLAATAAYAITGTAAALSVKLAAIAGSYAIAGTDADLIHDVPGEEIAADSGSYAITGTDAALRPARLVTDDDGDYAISGTDVTFLYGEVLPVDSGVYAISGQDTTLIDSGSAVNDHLLCVMGLGR
jgi:hypothetical protein